MTDWAVMPHRMMRIRAEVAALEAIEKAESANVETDPASLAHHARGNDVINIPHGEYCQTWRGPLVFPRGLYRPGMGELHGAPGVADIVATIVIMAALLAMFGFVVFANWRPFGG